MFVQLTRKQMEMQKTERGKKILKLKSKLQNLVGRVTHNKNVRGKRRIRLSKKSPFRFLEPVSIVTGKRSKHKQWPTFKA